MYSYYGFLIFIFLSLRFSSQSLYVKDNIGTNIEYIPVSTWIDGSPIDDKRVDGVIYIKRNFKYYLRNFSESKVNVKWFGAKGDGKTNDSEAVQKAVNCGYPVYFPPGIYKLNIVISHHVKIEGDGNNTIIIPYKLDEAAFLYKTKRPFWTYHNVLSNISFKSYNQKGIGIAFGNVDPNKKEIEDEYAGNVTFQNVIFKNFEKAVFFPFGNIGSNFYNCSFQENKYGVYSLNNKFGGDIMHAGNKYFYGSEFSSNRVGLYIHNTAVGFGGISFNDVIFQMNQINTYIYSDNTYMPIQFIDCWDEKSATEKAIEIDVFNLKEKKIKSIVPFGFYFEGKNSSYNFFGGRINNLKINGDNITVNSYSSNFEHVVGVEAKDSEISQNSYLNLNNPSSEQGIQIHPNIYTKGKISFPENTLLLKPNSVPYRVFLSREQKWDKNKIIKSLDVVKTLNLTGSFESIKIDFSNVKTSIKIPFTAPQQYMRVEESRINISPGYYMINLEVKVNRGRPIIYVWDRDKTQFIFLKPIADGKFYSYSGVGKLDKDAELYLDISSEDGAPVDISISRYNFLQADNYQELISWL